MRLLVFAALLFPLVCPALAQDQIRPVAGMLVTSDTRFLPGEYELPADSTGAIRIAGDSITVDFSGVILRGAANVERPDRFEGTGIRVLGGEDIVLIEPTVHGYRHGLWATDADGLIIDTGDFSYNYRQRLKSTLEREHLDDWMSYHQNEHDEWMRYGAAIYVRRSNGIRVHGVTVTGGQNGIMLTEVNDAVIQGNEVTFNSGIGIGLYRSSRNRLSFNALDFNVRGYSHGVYNRGQDSAAILLYEQSSENIIASNSATHSGDGLFLWAGQSTMDTGEGGCNDNLIVGNDFSFAPTNGIEVTFSRNTIRANTIVGCWHGIWGGYSFDTEISGNYFADNDEHIAVEHGLRLTIDGNTFVGGDQGIRLWERDAQPADWGYSRAVDVRSRDHIIQGNVFLDVPEPVNIDRSTSLLFEDNLLHPVPDSLSFGRSEDVRVRGNSSWSLKYHPAEAALHASESPAHEPPPGVPFPSDLPRGRRYMLVDEWGPHDFRAPLIWPRSSRTAAHQVFDILGPPGTWELTALTGADSVSARSGPVPDTLAVWLDQEGQIDLQIDLAFSGGPVTDRFGRRTNGMTPFEFSYSYSFVSVDWEVSFFSYDAANDPREFPEAFRKLLGTRPLHVERTRALSFGWYRSPAPSVPADHFATLSEGRFTVAPGDYEIEITSDDGVRVWLDETLIHEDWTWHPPKTALIPVYLTGSHTIRIEHFEIDGYATLIADVRKAPNEN